MINELNDKVLEFIKEKGKKQEETASLGISRNIDTWTHTLTDIHTQGHTTHTDIHTEIQGHIIGVGEYICIHEHTYAHMPTTFIHLFQLEHFC